MTIAFARYILRRCGLDYKKPKDVELSQFLTLTFSKVLERIEEAARAGHWPDKQDWYWIADKVLKARKAYSFWAGPSLTQATEATKLLLKVCEMLVKEYR